MRLDEERACLVCDYCGAVNVPQPNADGVGIVGEGSGEKCPVCGESLKLGLVGAQRVLTCENCHGVRIPLGSFLPLIEALRAAGGAFIAQPPPLDQKAWDRHLRCPECGDELDTHPYGGPGNVMIDVCERCSAVWLDQGELYRIAHSPDHVYQTALKR